MKLNPEKIIGNKYGKLTVLDVYHKLSDKQKYLRCFCQCDCGNLKEVRYNDLKRSTKSCGCIRSEVIRKRKTTHGLEKTKVYRAWINMRDRCLNPKNISHKSYVDKGITFDEKWNSFEKFFEDMGHPQKNESLDRIDNNGDYCKENCRWTTAKIQNNNRSSNRIIEYRNESKTVSEWCDLLGLNSAALTYRLNNKNWTIEEAFELPRYSQKHGRWAN